MPFYSCKTDHMSITMSTTVVLMNIGINLLLKSNFKTPTGAQPNFLFGFFFLELAVIRMKAVKLL